MDVQPVGRLVPLDEQGYVLPDVDREHIRPPWDAALDAIARTCAEHWGEALHSLYVRGSLPRGLAIEGFSDIDCYALVHRLRDADTTWIEEECARLDARYPFQSGIEIVPFDLDAALSAEPPHPVYRAVQFSLATNSLCILGQDVSATLPRFRPGRQIAVRTANLPRELREALAHLEARPAPEEVRHWCTWIMKRLLRTGFELVMEREHGYTRDLFYCCEAFARRFPSREREMREVLDLAVAPSDDADEVIQLLRRIGPWLLDEAERTYPRLAQEWAATERAYPV